MLVNVSAYPTVMKRSDNAPAPPHGTGNMMWTGNIVNAGISLVYWLHRNDADDDVIPSSGQLRIRLEIEYYIITAEFHG